MHEVQTCTRFVEPLTTARIRWMFGFQRRLERTCEWLMLTPNDGFLPHTSHTAAMTRFSDSQMQDERQGYPGAADGRHRTPSIRGIWLCPSASAPPNCGRFCTAIEMHCAPIRTPSIA